MFCHKVRAGFAAALAAGILYLLYAALAKYAPGRAIELMDLLHAAPHNAMGIIKGLIAIMGISFVFVYLFKLMKDMFACCGSECKTACSPR